MGLANYDDLVITDIKNDTTTTNNTKDISLSFQAQLKD